MKIIYHFENLDVRIEMPEKLTFWGAIKMRITGVKTMAKMVENSLNQMACKEKELIESREAKRKGQVH